jgi:hypothetical protein
MDSCKALDPFTYPFFSPPPSFLLFPLNSCLGSTTYVISASHSKKFSSLIGPAIIPSGGFRVSSETCTK